MQVHDVMTQHVISVAPNDAVDRAIGLMLQERVSGLPVIDAAGRLVGIVTEGDFLRRAETSTQRQRPKWLTFLTSPGRMAEEYVQAHSRNVSDVMTADPVTVTEETSLADAVSLMEKRRVKRLPVIRGDKVVGIVSRANLLHALASLSSEARPTSLDDKTIRERIVAELDKEKWAPVRMINVVVRNGVVDIWGTITDERKRRALIVAAENVPGVKRVNDHVAWIEPMSGMVYEPPGDARGADIRG
ncbi:MAG: CBS domain-containing protein [Xanthobacteraceae bacterium]|nr:CBS domain-containing protein [Xanthobacteraceae bacterium]